MKLPEKTARRMADNNRKAPACPGCEQRIIQSYCGRCDLFYTTCGCEETFTGGYDIDHTKCRSRGRGR